MLTYQEKIKVETTIYRLQYSNNHLQIVLKDLDLMWCGDMEMRGLL